MDKTRFNRIINLINKNEVFTVEDDNLKKCYLTKDKKSNIKKHVNLDEFLDNEIFEFYSDNTIVRYLFFYLSEDLYRI